ncbi:MAG: glutathione S-transferase family protein [Paracoccaceae bacterium]
MLTFYLAKGTVAVAVAILLEELGVPHHRRIVDFATEGQRSPDYLSLNPKGRVPAIATEDGVLTETGAILAYLAEAHGSAFLPDDLVTRAHVREVMFYLASTMHVAHAHKMRGARWADRPESWQDMAAKVPDTMADCCRHLEDALAFAPFAVGVEPIIADFYLFAVVRWAEGDGVTLTDTPRLSEWFEMMSERPSVRKLITEGEVL